MGDFKRASALLLGVLGMVTNLLLMVTLFRAQRGWNRLNLQLVGPIAGLDFLATFFISLASILSFAMGNGEMLTSSWYCPSIGVALQMLPVVSIVLIAAMSIDRYCLVVHGRGIRCLWGWLFISALCLLVGGLKAANVVVHGLHPDPTATYCQTFGKGELTKVNQRLSTTLFITGLPVVTFCYLGIFFHCQRAFSALQVFPKRSLIILLAYQICLLPKFITSIWKLFADKKTIPNFLIILAPLGFELLFLANPCLIFAFQTNLRQELRLIFFPRPPTDDIQLTDKPYSDFP